MNRRIYWAIVGAVLVLTRPLWGAISPAAAVSPPPPGGQATSGHPRPPLQSAISIEGAPADAGYNVGSIATIRATLKGISGEPDRYAVFADIQYVGATAVVSLQMDRRQGSQTGDSRYEAGWPIPPDAPAGIYSVVIRAEDRSTHGTIARQKLGSFAVYKKPVRIARVKLDKTFYSPGEAIECEVGLENLTDQEIKDLRVEFSNANYPWISLSSGQPNLSGKPTENPELGLKVLRDRLNLPPRGEATIPMMPAGTAAFLQGAQVAVLGAGGPARHEKIPLPEVDQYTIAVWNADRTFLYDMQFSSPAVVRPANRHLPKPYGRNFTHAYNRDIDFWRYRQFYAPGQISRAITVDQLRTSFRPSDRVRIRAKLLNDRNERWEGFELQAIVSDRQGKRVHTAVLDQDFDLAPGEGRDVAGEFWTVPASVQPGVYSLELALVSRDGRRFAQTTTDIAVNEVPASLLVFGPHEDDEHAYAGLIRSGLEAGIPVRVVILTGGDVGACERYYSKPCGPDEAREFGLVRMEETAEALEHIGLARNKLAFLGLPDGGLGAIWSRDSNAHPFLSIYLATDHAPYESIVKPNLVYSRDAVIEQVKQLIADFHPAMIATTHPDERHVDHRVTNWFVIKACQELLREKKLDPKTVILADQAYGAGGFKPAPYRYEKAPVYLSGEVSALKGEMTWLYQSQDGNLAEGLRKTFAELPREEVHYRIADWQEHEGWNE